MDAKEYFQRDPDRSTPKNKAGGGAARKGSASAVFIGFSFSFRLMYPSFRLKQGAF